MKVGPRGAKAVAPNDDEAKAGARRRLLRRVLGVGVALALLVLALGVLLPMYIERRVIDTLAAEGITASLRGTRLRWGSVRVAQVSLRFARPISAELHNVTVVLNGLTPERIEAESTALTLDLPVEGLLAELAMPAQKADLPFRTGALSVQSNAPLAGVSSLLVEQGELEVGGADAHLRNATLTLVTERGKMGPWSVQVTRENREVRVGVGLDGDNVRALYIQSDQRRRLSFQAKGSRIADWKLAQVPPRLLETRPDITLTLEGKPGVAAEVTGTLALHIAEVSLPPMPAPVDVSLQANVSGSPTELRIDRSVLAVGHISGGLAGKFSLPPGPIGFDAVGTFRDVPCAQALADFAPSAALRFLGDVAQNMGVQTGTLQATLRVTYHAPPPGAPASQKDAPSFDLQVQRACALPASLRVQR